MGFPFLTGFYSKDLILEMALTKYTMSGSMAYILGIITAFFTSYYSFRVFYMTFIAKNNSFRAVMSHIHELPLNMAIALMVLSLGSIFFGYFAKDLFVGLGTDFWNHSIFILPENNNQLDAEFFGLPNLSLTETENYYNSTYKYRFIKWLPFFSSVFAVFLVFSIFSDFTFHKNSKSTPENAKFDLNLISAPYISNNKILSWPDMPAWILQKSKFYTPNKQKDVENWIQLYTPQGFLKEYEKNGYFELPSQTDNPVSRSLEITLKPKYHFYQRLMLDFYVWQQIRLEGDKKWVLREVYRFLSYKWYFDAIYNEWINRPLLQLSYKTVFKSLDKGLLEFFGPYGISRVLFFSAVQMKKMQLGEVYYYAYLMITFLFISLIALPNFI